LDCPFSKKYFLTRPIGPAGHDEPGLLAFNGRRFGGLGKNRRSADRARSGDKADESGVFTHAAILTRLALLRQTRALNRPWEACSAAKKRQFTADLE